MRNGEDQPSPAQSPNSFQTDIEGTLTSVVVNLRPEGAIIAYRLTDASFNVNSDGAIFLGADAIKADLMKPMFALVDPQGKIRSVRFDDDVDYSSQTFGRTLLGITQFVFPDSPGSNIHQWESQEDDPAGQYMASYITEKDAITATQRKGIVVYKKTKTKYLEPPQKHSSHTAKTVQVARIIEPGNGFSVEFDFDAGRVKSFQGTETQNIVRGGKQIGHAANSVRLEFVKEDNLGSTDSAGSRAKVR